MPANTLRDRIEQLQAYKALSELRFLPVQAMGIAKNIKMLSKEVDLLEDIKKSVLKIEGLAEYEAARLAICEEYCAKDEKGSPMIVGGSFAFPSKDVFEIVAEKVKVLDEKHSSSLKEKETFEVEYARLLDSVVEVPLISISLSSCRGEISPDLLSPIVDFLTE